MTRKTWKTLTRRSSAALLIAAMLTTPALALFGKNEDKTTEPKEGAPIAKAIEVRTYRGIPYQGTLLSTDPEGDEVTYSIDREPKRGTVTLEGDAFTYTPEENKTGKDSFTYIATDANGNASAPAEVTVIVEKTRSGVKYADMDGNPAAPAAQALAENGIFTGGQIGGQYFFEPDRQVTRNEFLAMTMETAGLDATAVTMTGFCDDNAIPTWAKAYAAAGLSEGVVHGVSTEEGVAFRGERPITFNEAATILDRVLSVGDVDLATWYADREAVPSWAAQAVGNMESVNVMASGSFGSSTLDQPLTRADAAMMLSSAGTLLEGEPAGLLDWLG